MLSLIVDNITVLATDSERHGTIMCKASNGPFTWGLQRN